MDPESRSFGFLQQQSLQILVATKEALLLWRNMYYNPAHNGHPVWIAFPQGLPESRREISSVPIPPLIRAIIDNRTSTIGEEVKMWEVNFRAAVTGEKVLNMWDKTFARRHRRYSFEPPEIRDDLSRYNVSNEHHVDILVKGFDNIVCNPDGTICFRNSVRNFLAKEESLDRKIRFRIACMFCLEDEIMRTWQWVHYMPNIFDDSKLMQYWKNKLNNVAVNGSSLNVSNEVLLISLEVNRNWAAIEYLWDKVNEGVQIYEAIAIIRDYDFYSMKRVLLKLNENQLQNSIYPHVGDCIFSKIVTHPEYYEYAIDSWACMKNYILREMFVKIVHQLWELVFNPRKSEITRVNYNSSTLLKVWTSATNSLKSKVSVADLFEKLDGIVRGVHHYALKFMFELLANTSDPLKKEIWLRNWRKLLIRSKPSNLERLMKVCLGSDDEIEKFKESAATNIDQLNHYFIVCLRNGLYPELNDYLNFFVKNPHRLENKCKEIIISSLNNIASFDDDETTQCHLFIRSTFCDAEKADQFIKGMISSRECLSWIYCKLDHCSFDEVANLSRRFPSNNENFKEMKEEFLVRCLRNFARGQISRFYDQSFVDFICWCDVGEEKLSELKNSLIIDDIFEIILNNVVQDPWTVSPLFTEVFLNNSFEHFLRWYFGSSEAAKNYKSHKLINCNEREGVKNALRTGNSTRVEKFLNWGLENDKNEVEKVKLRLSQ